MAIYHLTAQVLSRSRGQNAIASAAYRRAAALYDEQEHKTHDYTQKQGVIFSELLVPENAPHWAEELSSRSKSLPPFDSSSTVSELSLENSSHQQSERLWNLVEQTEKRKDSQLAREIEFSLPIELNQAQCIHLAREFIQQQFVTLGMISDWSVHWDQNNPHVHVMLTMRALEDDGFGMKVTAWNKKELLEEWRKAWADYVNVHLHLHGHAVRIDHRSYREQGIELLPTIHLGKAVMDMTHRGIETERAQRALNIRNENLDRIVKKPNVLMDKVTLQRDHFEHKHVANALGTYVSTSRDLVAFSQAVNSEVAQQPLHSSGTTTLSEAAIESPLHTQHTAALTANILASLNNSNVNGEERSEKTLPERWLTPEKIRRILEKIEIHDAVFNEHAIAKALATEIVDAPLFARALIEVKHCNELIALGIGDDGREQFTTRKMFKLENDIQQLADQLRNLRHQKISKHFVSKALARYEKNSGKALTDEQRQAVKHLVGQQAICCLVGRAGTGKSFSLGAAQAIWHAQHLNVYGIALSGIAADGLQRDAGINARTIESFTLALQKGALTLDEKSIVVMDEAGMTDSVSMHAVLSAVQRAHSKLVLIGDPNQLQPVGPGAVFRALLERLGFAQIHTVYRQHVAWQREATQHLAAGKVREAIDAYDKHHLIRLENNAQSAFDQLVHDWHTSRAPIHERLVLAHRNSEVMQLNHTLRKCRVDTSEIADGYRVNTKTGPLLLSSSDRILFLKNNTALGVSNGRFATVAHVEMTETGQVLWFDAVLDGKAQQRVRINPNDYPHFTYGYAATVHKSQGTTFDETQVYLGESSWRWQLFYVALSRHRHHVCVYGDRERYPMLETLKRQVQRFELKDSILNFPRAFGERRGIEPNRTLEQKWSVQLTHKLKTLTAALTDKIEMRYSPERYRQKRVEAAQHKTTIEQREQRRQDAVVVAHYFDACCDVGKAWGTLEPKMKQFGLKPNDYRSDHYLILKSTPEYQQCEHAFMRREQFAAEIVNNLARYEDALNFYGIDREALQKQALKYTRREKVKTYLAECVAGRVVFRDKLAYELAGEFKVFYPFLKSLGADPKTIREHALHHARNRTLIPLTQEERAAFHGVEQYVNLNHRISHYQKGFQQKAATNQPSQRAQAIEWQHLILQRNHLASMLVEQPERYAKALDFYQIGQATIRLPYEMITKEHAHFAVNRWFTLQVHAANHNNRERVEAYLKTFTERNDLHCQELAQLIVSDARAHHGAIVALTSDPASVWKTIRQDAKAFAQNQFRATLSSKEQHGFLLVEQYVAARHEHKMIWREIFESQKVLDKNVIDAPSTRSHLSIIKNKAERISQKRDHVAAAILSQLKYTLRSLDYFKIEPSELNKSAFAELCRQRVQDYIAAHVAERPDPLAISRLAHDILKDPGAHVRELSAHHITLNTLYKEARLTEQQQLFKSLYPAEKRLLRTEKQLKHVTRQIGKSAQHLRRLNTDELQYSVTSQRFNYLLSRRDQHAERLIHQHDGVEYAVMFDEMVRDEPIALPLSVNLGKVRHHAVRHQQRVAQVLDWKELFENGQSILSTHYQSKGAWSENNPQVIEWLAVESQMRKVAVIIEREASRYHPAFIEARISPSLFTHANFAANEIKAFLTRSTQHDLASSHKTPLNDEHHIKIARALRTLKETQPIENTLAERYLREHRNIVGPLPKSFRYHPAVWNSELKRPLPALVVTATSSQQQLRAIQLVYLDEKTANKASLNTKKITLGAPSAEPMAVVVNRGRDNKLIAVAEGPETALSIKEAYPEMTIYCTLGVQNFKRIPISPDTTQILFCADNDGINSPSQKTLQLAAQHLSSKQVDIWQAMPGSIAGLKKTDFNDVLKQQGVETIREQLQKATLLKPAMTATRRHDELSQHLSTLTGEQITRSQKPPPIDPLNLSATTENKKINDLKIMVEKLDSLKENPAKHRVEILLLEKSLSTQLKWLTQDPKLYAELKTQYPILAERVMKLVKNLGIRR